MIDLWNRMCLWSVLATFRRMYVAKGTWCVGVILLIYSCVGQCTLLVDDISRCTSTSDHKNLKMIRHSLVFVHLLFDMEVQFYRRTITRLRLSLR